MSNEPRLLEPRNVFIDTSEFVRLSFAFNSGVLEILAKHPRIRLILSEVVVSEVRSHLDKAAAESVRLHKQFSDKARVLRNLGGQHFAHFFDRFVASDVAKSLIAAFENFLQSSDALILPIADTDLSEVFRRYCALEPPFEDGRKKSEFPDAIALDAAERWAKRNGAVLQVISKDQGMQAYCHESERLSYVASVEKFLDLAVRDDKEVAERTKAFLESQRDVYEEQIIQDFPLMGFYVEGREGDVEDVTVTNVEFQDFLIVELQEGAVTIEVYVTVSFTAVVSYEDLEHGIYDSETKSLWAGTVSSEWDREFEGNVRLRLEPDPDDPEDLQVEQFIINENKDLGLSYDDGWPY